MSDLTPQAPVFPYVPEQFLPSPPPRPQRRWLNLVLLLATMASTFAAGLFNSSSFWHDLMPPEDALAGMGVMEVFRLLPWPVWRDAAFFCFCVMSIMGAHEMGHYLTARRYGVDVSLPYFIPFPNFLGTMGAFIRIRSPIITKTMLFDIGIAGPIAGFLVAVPVAAWGLMQSAVGEASASALEFGEPLLMKAMGAAIFGGVPEGRAVFIHPVAFAGWFGLLLTAFNLLPVGQLDGGHVLYAWMGDAYRWAGRLIFLAALILSWWWLGWLLWCAVFLFMGFRHPRVVYPMAPLERSRLPLLALALLMLILCFIPVPVKYTGG